MRQIACLGGGGEGDQHHEQQQHQVEEQQRAIHLRDGPDQRVVVDPHDADHEEADQVGQEGRPLRVQLVQERAVPRPVHSEVEREQRDGHGEDAVAERLEPGPVHQLPNLQLAAGLGSTLARIWSTQSWMWACRPGMSLLAKLSSMASTRSWPFRISSCCLAISCSAIRVSWSAMARRSLAARARLALTCSEIMMDSCGRFKMVSSSGHGVLSNPTTLPRKSQATMPIVMPMNTYIEPQNLLTASAIRSRMLVPRTCSERTSLGLCASGSCLILSARSMTCAVASSMARRAAASVSGRGRCGDSAAWLCAGEIVSVIVILRAGHRRLGRPRQAK